MSGQAGMFAATGLALYVGGGVGDYWVQTDAQALHKGDPGWAGRLACLAHVVTYVATQALCVWLMLVALGIRPYGFTRGLVLAYLVSGVTHYLADRREFGLMFWLARLLPEKAAFLTLGKPRPMVVEAREGLEWESRRVPIDGPVLTTGAWALDQSWHLFFGVFVPALILAS